MYCDTSVHACRDVQQAQQGSDEHLAACSVRPCWLPWPRVAAALQLLHKAHGDAQQRCLCGSDWRVERQRLRPVQPYGAQIPVLNLLHRQVQHRTADGVCVCANAERQAGGALDLQTVLQLRVYLQGP